MARLTELLARIGRELGSPAEARTLLAHVLDREPSTLLLLDEVPDAAASELAGLVRRRRDGVPLQHLTGVAHFRTVAVEVGPGVFIPRPETEVMTGWALECLGELGPSPLVVELCAGSGAIARALAAEHPGVRLVAVERSDAAVAYLERNLGGSGARIVHADMADALPELNGTVDLVIANPPYIPLPEWEGVPREVREHDPSEALFAGEDGLDALRVVADVAARLLRDGGWVCAEHADVQGTSAPRLFVRHGAFTQVSDRRDLNDRPRYVVARARTGRMGT